jgi:hypothetical protein
MNEILPAEILEARAAEQRRRLHDSLQKLRGTVRERIDIRRNVRQHFLPVASIAGMVGLLFGYSFGGIFTRH